MPARLNQQLAPLVIAAFCCSLLAGCGSEADTPVLPRPVRSIVIAPGAYADSMTYTAEIRSRYASDLSFQVGGKLIHRTVDIGSIVRKGDVIAQLEETDQRLGVEAARSAAMAARAELDRARVEETRYRDLLERGLTTRASYLAQQTAVKTSQSKLEQATADLRLNEQRLSYTKLRADADGVVTNVHVDAGAVVSAGQRIVSIAQPSQLEAVFDVPDAHIHSVRGTQEVVATLLTDPTQRYAARVREISPDADPVTRTYQVKTTLTNPSANLRLGMTTSIVIPQGTAAVGIAMPSSALFQAGHAPAVWIVTADHTLELRSVQVQRYESNRVFVASGVAPGERIVTAGVHRLASGEKVRLLEEVRS